MFGPNFLLGMGYVYSWVYYVPGGLGVGARQGEGGYFFLSSSGVYCLCCFLVDCPLVIVSALTAKRVSLTWA